MSNRRNIDEEDAVPVNAVGSGSAIAGFDPMLGRRKRFRVIKRKIQENEFGDYVPYKYVSYNDRGREVYRKNYYGKVITVHKPMNDDYHVYVDGVFATKYQNGADAVEYVNSTFVPKKKKPSTLVQLLKIAALGAAAYSAYRSLRDDDAPRSE